MFIWSYDLVGSFKHKYVEIGDHGLKFFFFGTAILEIWVLLHSLGWVKGSINHIMLFLYHISTIFIIWSSTNKILPWTKFRAQIWEWMLSTYLIFFYTHLLLLWSRKNPFETIGLEYDESGKLCENCSRDQVKHKLNQTLWPDHCVMNTNGAKIKESVSIKDSDIDIRKGFNCEVSYLVIGEKW